MVRCFLVSVACVLFMVLSATSDPTTKPATDPRAAALSNPKGDARQWEALAHVINEVNFKHNNLADVFDFLCDVTDVNLNVNWKALASLKVDGKSPVTLRLKDATLATILTAVCDDAAGGRNKVAWVVEGGVVTLSTAEDLHGSPVTHTYDIRFITSHDYYSDATKQERADTLAKLITDTVDPHSWHENAGDIGIIKAFGTGQLVVSQTEDNHVAIRKVIQRLKDLIGDKFVDDTEPPIFIR